MAAAEKHEVQFEGLSEALKHIPFFSHFDDEFIFELAKNCELVEYDLGEEILKQGEHNRHLYFLLDGRVSVVVDGDVVAELTDAGDVLGEMSVITQQPCMATIIADSDVQILRIEMEILEESADMQSDRFKYLLYKVYSSVLTKKLNETNFRVRPFEAMSISMRKLIQLKAQNMDSLRGDLSALASRSTPPTQAELAAASRKLANFLEHFEALTKHLNI